MEKSDQQGSKSVEKRALSTKIHRVYFKWVSIFYFKFDRILILKGETMNNEKRPPSNMVKEKRRKRREKREEE